MSVFLLAGCSQEAGHAQAGPEDLIFVQQGAVPIILTAPHGGTLRVPGVERERSSRAAVKFRDDATDEIAEVLMDRLEALVGGKPYAVVARFHRRYIDANRRESLAFEDTDARPPPERVATLSGLSRRTSQIRCDLGL